ncbi:superoxide dismutase family protein [Arthrobacter sp. I2-34]|uniref:Superoxide dismutase family protein n=1 Tax=Arthrobacter hankyongi TaxID=2904801 RepID=A0ABS9L1H1_9MICC|nr:superoxide dismutase family protein [Arthrobacter hankyongi]MCG2620520.1 superoxide dismutase family protein [Arthrobacter hankyongi]
MVPKPGNPRLTAAAAAAILLALAGCGETPTGSGQQSAVAPSSPMNTGTYAEGQPVTSKFSEFEDATAITYHQPEVPKGANAVTVVKAAGNGTAVSLKVEGLAPNREFGAHVHVNVCGKSGHLAGPHYQNKKDPVQPSVDPAYANPKNEVWLDFKTDQDGNAQVDSTVDWKFRAGEGRSIVIHAMPTMTEKGKAGTAGERLACLNIR